MAIVKVQPLSDLFTAGRACPLTAVVLHEYKSDLSTLDNEMQQCVRLPKPLCSPSCHKSFHFGIGANCLAHQYINITDTAWGFWYEPTPACPIPPCPIVQTCDGVGADQYNPHLDSTPATPNVSVGGVCLDANCSVIHVAVSVGAGRVSDGIYCVRSPQFSEAAYTCLVQALCEIFELAGLTPDGYTNLLTHIGELASIDLDQLAIDIQACLDFVPPPPPPCECTVPPPVIVGTDTATVDMVVAGLNISANVRISAAPGNSVVANGDGLFVPVALPVTCATIAALFTPTAVPMAPGEPIFTNGGGACNTQPFPTFCELKTASPATVPGGIATPGVTQLLGVDCLSYTIPVVPVETPNSATDTNSVNLTLSGPFNRNIQADVNISPAEGNILVELPTGLYVPVTNVCADLSSQPIGAPLVPGDLVLGDDCEYHAFPAAGPETPFVATTTPSILATPGGVNGHSPVYDVRISATPGNTASINPDGVFVPAGAFDLCAAVGALPVGTPLAPGDQVLGADCQLHTVPLQNAYVDCAGTAIANGAELITPANLFSGPAAGSITPTILVAPADAVSCPQTLGVFDLCGDPALMDIDSANDNAGFHVLAKGPNDLVPRWRLLGNGHIFGGDIGGGAIGVNNPALSGVKYVSTTDSQTIEVPADSCSRTEVFVKNIGAVPITITGVGTNIDGQPFITLNGTIPAGYPFGNNGGEAVHLVWNPGRAEWQVW